MAEIRLRDYQETMISRIRAEMRAGKRRILLQMPTGAGKTITAGYMLGTAAERGKASFFLCNRRELIDQTCKSLEMLGIDHGIIAAGYKPRDALVQVGSIDTLKVRQIAHNPAMVIWDECRGLGAAGWERLFKGFGDAYHIGLDATPIRGDGRGLGDFFEVLVGGITIRELIERGALVKPRVFTPDIPNLSGVKIKHGDYAQDEIEEAMGKPSIVGNAIEYFARLGEGRQGIVFCPSVKFSVWMAERFTAAGFAAAHLDGNTDKTERKETIDAFRRKELRLLCNVGLFRAGLDVPNVSYICDMSPTKSLANYLQQCGRASRPAEGKSDYLLVDHTGNFWRHGSPDMDREWTLEGMPKQKRGEQEKLPPMTQCPKCYATYAPASKCPECGHQHEAKPREIDVKSGELREVKETYIPRAIDQKMRWQQEASCKTLADFQALAAARGYKPGWAWIRWKERFSRAAESPEY